MTFLFSPVFIGFFLGLLTASAAALFFSRNREKTLLDAAVLTSEKEGLLKKQEVKVRTEQAKVTALLNQMAEGVIGVDQHSRALVLNPSAQRILELSSKSHKGRSLLEITGSVEADETMALVLKDRAPQALEILITHPAEKRIHASFSALPPETGEIRGIVVFYDVTELRRLETLRQEFVANVSHELRTPLTSIKGFLETLLAGALNDKSTAEKFLKIMQDDTERLSRLVTDLLELSRIESPAAGLKKAPVNLLEEIQKTAAIFLPQLKAKNIVCETPDPEKNPVRVSADPDKLKQILLNLMDNAVKFNKMDGRIVIAVEKNSKDAKVTISDTGTGIPPESLSRVFERFYRVEKSRTGDAGGSGLGLSIVKHIVEAHGGQVSCQSQLGQGTSFIFTLPLA